MTRISSILIIVVFLAYNCKPGAENSDSLSIQADGTTLPAMKHVEAHHRFTVLKQLAFSTLLIGVGAMGVRSDWVESRNREIDRNLNTSNRRKTTIDDYMQYLPMVAVYGLNWAGIECEHTFAERTVILATAYSIMGLSVNGLKAAISEKRPDGSGNSSFPSGHTATAFMGAEFLWQEYRHTSPAIGVSGYAVATATGILRMYNHKHWLTDVATGAGIGILSTKAAYYIYPALHHLLFKGKLKNSSLMPEITTHGTALCWQMTF